MSKEFLKTIKGPGIIKGPIIFASLLVLVHKEMEEFGLPHPPKERPFHSDKPIHPFPGKPLEIPIRRKR